MRLSIAVVVLVLATLAFATPSGYKITILDEKTPDALYRPESQPPENLAGKTFVEIFGPIEEIRVEAQGVNLTGIEKDQKKLKEKIRARIDRAKCVGVASEKAWHMAPWLRGYVLLKSGRILPIEILLDGFVAGELLFADNA